MDPNIGLQIAFVKVAELIRVIYSEAMAAPKLPSLLELFKAEKPSDLVAGLPTPLVAKLYEQMKAVRDQLGGANVPPDPAAMAAKYAKWKVMDSRHLVFISEKIAEICDTGSAVYIATPPKHFKSSLCSGWLPVWFLAKFPEAHVLLVSYSATEARKWGFKARTLVETYGAEYGLYMNPKKLASDDWELTSGGGMVTIGVGSGLGGKQANLFIIDDAIGSMEDANSPVLRAKLWEWWESTAIQRIEPGTPVVCIGTRYSTDDLMGRMLQQSESGEGIHFDKVILPSLALADDPLGRALGEGLWLDNPRVGYTQKFYDDRKRDISGYAFASVYQQNPIAAGGNMVDPEWWEYYTPSELPKDFDQVVQSWDLSLDSVKKSDSYHAGLVVARKGSLIFILDSFHKHCDINGVIDQILAWNRIYPEARQKLVERATSGVAVVQMLKSRVPGMLAWPPKGRQKGSKEACLDACIPDIRAHNIYLPKRPNGSREKWVDEFVMECMAFPRGAHDDWVDAFSQAVGFMLPAVRRVVAGETEDAMGQRPPLAPTEAHNQFLHATMNRLSARGLDQLKQAAGDGRRVIAFSRAQRIGLGAARRVC